MWQTDVVPGTHKLSPLLGYGGRQPNRPADEPNYNKLLIEGDFHKVMSEAGHLTTERVHKPQRMVLKKGDIWLVRDATIITHEYCKWLDLSLVSVSTAPPPGINLPCLFRTDFDRLTG
jgi:hypothetical protein